MIQQSHGLCMEYKNPEDLRRLYCRKGMSLPQIARKFDVDPTTILYHMKKHGIERRDRPQEKPLSVRTSSNGYSAIRHIVNGEEHEVKIHRLIAVAEYGFDAVIDHDVHHKSGVPWDNRRDNLELITRSEHMTLHNDERGELMSKYGKKAHE